METPIFGGSYVASTVHAANNRMVNLFPEIIKEGGKQPAFLKRTAGLRSLVTAGAGPIRGLWQFGDYGYAVSGSTLYRITDAWTAEAIGSVTFGGDPVSMADNGTQLFVACGSTGFIYNATTRAFAQITDPDFVGAVTVGYLDGYFVFNQVNTQTFWITSLLDGTSVDPLDFASAEALPDLLLGLFVDHRELWLFGQKTVEVWYNKGAGDFPFERIQGALLEVGAASPYCMAKLDNTIVWLGHDGIVYRANGYVPVRISTHALESWIVSSEVDTSQCVAYSYRDAGHQYFVLVFPDGDSTWVYDIATDTWHERAAFLNGSLDRHRASTYMFFNGTHVVGDFENGNLYALDHGVYADNALLQKWVRSWRALPTGTNDLKRQIHHALHIDFETGTGNNDGQGDAPQVMLRWSDDGGKTWSNEHWRSLGAIGNTRQRVYFRRLGGTEKLRDRVYEISGTDPVQIAICGAFLDVEETRG